MNRDFGMLLARSAIGLAFAAHGAQKAFGSFGGPGLKKAAGFFEGMGFKPGATYVSLAAYTEIGSGLLIAAGLGGPAGPAGLIGVMTVAGAGHLKDGFFVQNGGVEINVLYGAAALAFAMGGYGRYSLDAATGLDAALAHDKLIWAAVAAGVAGGLVILAQRESPPTT